MFDIGWSELLVIAVVAIVVVGPKDLPRLMRTFGHYAGKLRRAAADFQRQFEDAMRETELEEVRKAIESVRNGTPEIDLKAPIDKPIMLPSPSAEAVPAQVDGKGAARDAPQSLPSAARAAPKRKRTPRPEAQALAAAAGKVAPPKPKRSRKAKPQAKQAEREEAQPKSPPDAERKP
jgi:sec-independent protein translocase protein TatB